MSMCVCVEVCVCVCSDRQYTQQWCYKTGWDAEVKNLDVRQSGCEMRGRGEWDVSATKGLEAET